MEVRLLCTDAVADPPEIVVTRFPAVLGRAPEAQVPVSDCWASRLHCVLERADGTLRVRDLGSRHGTWVNGALVSEACLQPGDRLTVGITTFEIAVPSVAVRRFLSFGRAARA